MTFAGHLRRTILPLVVITIIGVAVAPLSSPTTSTTGSDRLEFREFMEPRLLVLLDSAEEVEAMVEERSRNVVALRAEASRIEALVSEIDEYLLGTEVPASMAGVVQHYRLGTDLILTAIDGAWNALQSFDFSVVPGLIPIFSEGTDHVELAISTLHDLQDAGSSYTGSGGT